MRIWGYVQVLQSRFNWILNVIYRVRIQLCSQCFTLDSSDLIFRRVDLLMHGEWPPFISFSFHSSHDMHYNPNTNLLATNPLGPFVKFWSSTYNLSAPVIVRKCVCFALKFGCVSSFHFVFSLHNCGPRCFGFIPSLVSFICSDSILYSEHDWCACSLFIVYILWTILQMPLGEFVFWWGN